MPIAKQIHLKDVPGIRGLEVTVEAPDFGITLKLINSTEQPYRVALTGAVLQPENNDYQRLLVTGTEARVDHVFLPSMKTGHCVFLPPNGEAEAILETTCMDEALAPPDGNDYEVGREMAPDRLAVAARAFCTTVSMGKASPVKVTRDMVQSACWDKESEEDEKVLDEAVASGNFN